MSDNEDREDEQHNTQGTPNQGSTEADTASGGAPDDDEQSVDPNSGSEEDGTPVENPSGG